ncbi:MAG: ABC transporter permease [Lachnospiraceae bacterium]|jgi:putative aldouronate transport system permease protein
MAKTKSAAEKLPFSVRRHRFAQKLWRQRSLLLMAAFPMALLIIFKYVPIYGILIAFKKYRPSRGVWGSEWLDPFWKNYTKFFKNVNSSYIIWNTVRVGVLTLLFTYPMPIIFALLLNELRGNVYKRVVQTISYIPHFISIVVVCSMLNSFGSLSGMFNDIRAFFGLARIDMNHGDTYFLQEYIGSAVWQGVGWGSIIYLSALSNVDTSLYDVANLDGANRWQKMRHIALPAILPTSTVILIMNAGNVMNSDYTKILLMQNDSNRSELEVISTFVYHQGIEAGEFSYSTAVNLFASVISFCLVFGTNMIVRRISPENSLW